MLQLVAGRLSGKVRDVDAKVITPQDLELFYRPRDLILTASTPGVPTSLPWVAAD